ncbi:hypothetical protein IHE45_18G095400 [Dioscorea alata]|uniref:Uncharacterized protein n=1 Tax=Dioscorea alata TaxID=55571 RepID=A0ACB7U8Y3_DIOAL|nr:hypothetical protein IHE45_18G095400 [Dioscorea alata]
MVGKGEITERRLLNVGVNDYSNPEPTPATPGGGPSSPPYVDTLQHDGLEYTNKKLSNDAITDDLNYHDPRTSPGPPPEGPATDDPDYDEPCPSPGPPGEGPVTDDLDYHDPRTSRGPPSSIF